jgi:hypothetical protein
LKAYKVYEKIDFTRGSDPKSSLGIGNKAARLAEELSISLADLRGIYNTLRNYVSEDPKGFIEDLEDIVSDPWAYDIRSDGQHDRVMEDLNWALDNPDDAYKIRLLTNEDVYMHNESQNERVSFERGRDPKTSLDVGIVSKLEVVRDFMEKKIPERDLDGLSPIVDWSFTFQYEKNRYTIKYDPVPDNPDPFVYQAAWYSTVGWIKLQPIRFSTLEDIKPELRRILSAL